MANALTTPIPFEEAKLPGIRILKVHNDSLGSKFRTGDLAFVDTSDLRVDEGYYLFDFCGAPDAYRVQPMFDGTIRLLKDDPRTPVRVVTKAHAEAHILGRVVCAMVRV